MAIRSFGGYIYILEQVGADNVLNYDPSKNSVKQGFVSKKTW
jgi:hypothetical protein